MVEQHGEEEAGASSGLCISWTTEIDEFLRSARPPDAAVHLHGDKPVPYKVLRDAWCALAPQMRPHWRNLLAGSTFVFNSPKTREKSEELKARLARFQDMAERKAYQDLIKDVAHTQPEEIEYFSSYKNQFGFGLHVVFIMFTGYLAGTFLFRSQFGGSPILHVAGGISGMVVGMLLETVLFIIRASEMDAVKHKVRKASNRARPKND